MKTLYTYHCPTCGIYEEFREENDKETCECGSPLTKEFGGNFKLYGTGFYSTDSAVDKVRSKKR